MYNKLEDLVLIMNEIFKRYMEKNKLVTNLTEDEKELSKRGRNLPITINKRSNGIVKSMVIGASAGKKTLLIESLITGKENKLIFIIF